MKEKCLKLIRKNKFEEVIDRGFEYFKPGTDEHSLLVAISGELTSFEQQKMGGTILQDDKDKKENAIRERLVKFVNTHYPSDLETKVSDSPPTSNSFSEATKGSKSSEGNNDSRIKKFEQKSPYKFLDYYDLEDADHFFGRDVLIDTAYEEWEERFNSTGSKNAICIIGHSGAGKSSFLRAGLLARFKKEKKEEIQLIVFRPTSLRAISDDAFDPILGILNCIEEQVDAIKITARMRENIRRCRGVKKVEALLRCIGDCLAKAYPDKKTRLLFGIDQFEWIIDYLMDENAPEQWELVLRFVEAAVESETFGVAYTLETSRKHKLLEWLGDRPSIFKEDRYEIEVDGYHTEFIYSIIKCPFEKEGYVLSRERIKKLMSEIKAFISPEDICTLHSLLPIIAYRLSKLFDYIKRELPQPESGSALKPIHLRNVKEQSSGLDLEGLFDAAEERFGFEAIIEELAEEYAWKEGYQGAEESAADQVEYFLHPLIGISTIPNDYSPRLKTMPWPTYKDERQLIESFERNRLIVRMPDGQLRLINHQVIHWWKRAKNWYNEEQQTILKKEIKYLRKAEKWDEQGCPELTPDAIPAEQIDDAVEILSGYIRHWSIVGQPKTELTNEDKLLSKYCISLLKQSTEPDRIVTYKGYETNHIYRAAQYGLVDLIKRFCQNNPAYLKKKFFKKERTLLHEAAWSHPELVEYLLEVGASPNTPDKQGWPPIAAAIIMGRRDIFDLFLNKKISKQGLFGPTGLNMLHSCAGSGQKEMAEILMNKYKLPVDKPDNNGFIPLHYAASNGNEEMFKFLAERPGIPAKDRWDRTVLHFAAEKGHHSLVQYLQKNESLDESFFSVKDTGGDTALHYAASNHQPETVLLLLEACDPNQTNHKKETPLHLAIGEGRVSLNRVSLDRQINTIKVLLDDYQTDPNLQDQEGRTPLEKANQLWEIRELLLRHPRFDPMAPSGMGKQIIACIRGEHWEALMHLSDKAKGVLDEHGNTLLHVLAMEKELPLENITFKALLNELIKTDVNTVNKEKRTPPYVLKQTPLQVLLSKAKQSISWDLVNEMLDAPELKLSNYEGGFHSVLTLLLFDLFDELNPIDSSIKENILAKIAKWDFLQILLSQRDHFHWTPLHRLIVCQQIAALQWLIERGIDLTQVEHLDLYGRKPIDLATAYIRKELGLDERSALPAKSWDGALVWRRVNAKKRAKLVKQVVLDSDQYPIDQQTIFELSHLSFYSTEEVQLLRVHSESWNQQALKVYFLYAKEKLYRLKGESPPIHEVNALGYLKISESSYLDYLRFFCFFVRGEEGPFLIAEGIEQAEIPHELSPEDREEAARILIPACLSRYDEQANTFFVSASVYYSNFIFYADFIINANTGMVEMVWDYPASTRLSKRIHQPLEIAKSEVLSPNVNE